MKVDILGILFWSKDRRGKINQKYLILRERRENELEFKFERAYALSEAVRGREENEKACSCFFLLSKWAPWIKFSNKKKKKKMVTWRAGLTVDRRGKWATS